MNRHRMTDLERALSEARFYERERSSETIVERGMNNDYRLTDRQQELYDALRKGHEIRLHPRKDRWSDWVINKRWTRQAKALIAKGLCVAVVEQRRLNTVTTLRLAPPSTHLTGGAI